MAGFSLLALLDDIASILDDVALMTKVAARKSAGVLGDDLALNARQVAGVVSERELPVVWAVAKGSFVNKAVLVPAALLISAFLPGLITPLLMLGGAYLCYEGAEKVLHRFFGDREGHGKVNRTLTEDPAQVERKKIRGAIRTDFVLSAEIIVIALGTIPEGASFVTRTAVLVLIGLLMTVGVYGLVAGIVKLDDAGMYLMRKFPEGRAVHRAGSALVSASPRLMRLLTIVGTVAMFMVGGGILFHGIPWLHPLSARLASLPAAFVWESGVNMLVGFGAGAVLCLPVLLWRRVRSG